MLLFSARQICKDEKCSMATTTTLQTQREWSCDFLTSRPLFSPRRIRFSRSFLFSLFRVNFKGLARFFFQIFQNDALWNKKKKKKKQLAIRWLIYTMRISIVYFRSSISWISNNSRELAEIFSDDGKNWNQIFSSFDIYLLRDRKIFINLIFLEWKITFVNWAKS